MRRLYLDWLRGLAVVIMIFWHSMDSWSSSAARHAPVFTDIVFLGGWAAPLFLFLAGVSVALAGAKRSPRSPSHSPHPPSLALQRRGWEVFGLAFLFRLQSFILNPGAPLVSLLKPDILNILGLGMVAAAFCWGRASTRWGRFIWLAGPTALVVLLSPASRTWAWPARLGALAPPLEGYIRPVAGVGGFSLFPWVAFMFAGALVGSLIAEPRPDEREPSFHLWLGGAGLALTLAGLIGSRLPSPVAGSSFWTTSLSFLLIRLGVMIAAIALAWLWMSRPGASAQSPMVIFGQTSLFVYWVHVELAYGFASYPLHGVLPLAASFSAFLGLTALMLGAAILWRRRARPLVPEYLKASRV